MGARPDRLDLLDELRALEERVRSLGILLEAQRRQVESWNNRLYGTAPADFAARRLLSLKHAGR